ncbi:MAG: arylsulfatase, partial [Bryobacteraceae bacterium]
PNIDRLAAEGMRFTDCYAGATVCAPSRSCLITGQHTGHTTVRSNSSTRTGARVPLRAEDPSIAKVLKGPQWRDGYDEDRAYATGMFGKWGLGEAGTSGEPNDHGFDEWFGFLNQQHAHSHYPEFLWRGKQREVLPGNRDGGRKEYASDLFLREALYFIDRHTYEPFFLYLPFTVPHGRLEAPDLAPYENESWPEQEKTYAAMVTRLDGYVGRLMDKLRENGLDERTIVFFASDNGGYFNFPLFGGNGKLREKKGSVYEGGIRVPMIARWPGEIEPGVVSSHPWAFWDVLPTAAELTGATIPRNIDGISVLPVLLGQPPRDADRPLYWESHTGRGFNQAARMGNWKGVRHGLNGDLELYDLSKDEGESSNIAKAHPEVVRRMQEYLATARIDSAEYPVKNTA